MKLKPQNTAIFRKAPSKPLSDFLQEEQWTSNKDYRILDYGCGRGYDTSILKQMGFKAVGWDPFYECDPKPPLSQKFDAVLCIYILCVLPPEERKQAVIEAWDYVNKDGCLLLATRSWREVDKTAKASKWIKHEDGWVTKAETFQKGFSVDELRAFANMLTEVHYIETSSTARDYTSIKIIKR